jgi:Tol biopolymer transport system component
VFVWDRNNGTTTPVTSAERDSYAAAISADGRRITYHRHRDIYVWHRNDGTTTRVTHGNRPSNSPAISGDGRYVTFTSSASDLVHGDTNGRTDVFVWDRRHGTTTRITNGNSKCVNPGISGDGRYITYESSASDLVSDDTNGHITDVFVWDRGH